jgi:hypothetical protein
MQSEHNLQRCTCTTTTLKDGVDADTYAAMFAGGMSAVTRMKGAPAAAVRDALAKALRQCAPKG